MVLGIREINNKNDWILWATLSCNLKFARCHLASLSSTRAEWMKGVRTAETDIFPAIASISLHRPSRLSKSQNPHCPIARLTTSDQAYLSISTMLPPIRSTHNSECSQTSQESPPPYRIPLAVPIHHHCLQRP